MRQTDIHQFLKRYFLANNCSIVTETPSYLTVQLTIELDKELMNRPFYWHYIEKTGEKQLLLRSLSLQTQHLKTIPFKENEFILVHLGYTKFSLLLKN